MYDTFAFYKYNHTKITKYNQNCYEKHSNVLFFCVAHINLTFKLTLCVKLPVLTTLYYKNCQVVPDFQGNDKIVTLGQTRAIQS